MLALWLGRVLRRLVGSTLAEFGTKGAASAPPVALGGGAVESFDGLPLRRSFFAAVLFVDISGFTRLAETFSKRGTEGCGWISALCHCVKQYL